MKRCPYCQQFFPNDYNFCPDCEHVNGTAVELERNEVDDGYSSEDADDGIFEKSLDKKTNDFQPQKQEKINEST